MSLEKNIFFRNKQILFCWIFYKMKIFCWVFQEDKNLLLDFSENEVERFPIKTRAHKCGESG